MPLVFTNGVFDCLHAGHVQLLQYCRYLAGDGKVCVAIDTDTKVRHDKGLLRPYFTQGERRNMLRTLTTGCKVDVENGPKYLVDLVQIFDDNNHLIELIQAFRPDYIVKGGDWINKEVIGSNIAEVRFSQSASKELLSTSTMEKRILAAHENSRYR